MRFLLVMLLSAGLAWGEGFEGPSYQVGDGLDGKVGWKSNGAITSEMSYEGVQSLALKPAHKATFSKDAEGIFFIDFKILATYGDTLPSSIIVMDRRIEFRKDDEGGALIVLSNQSENDIQSEVLGISLVGDSDLSADWMRITVRIDAFSARWDLYVDALPVISNQELASAQYAIELCSGSDGVMYVDDWNVSAINPIFTDVDKDGMADPEELAIKLNPYLNDRDLDIDADGISNIDEYNSMMLSPSGKIVPSDFSSALFVDNISGDDRYVGFSSFVGNNGNGPKASIRAAMAVAPERALIIVLKGTGVYSEGSRSSLGKELTIRTIEPVVIK